jgi:hypothetical protein
MGCVGQSGCQVRLWSRKKGIMGVWGAVSMWMSGGGVGKEKGNHGVLGAEWLPIGCMK